MDVRGGHLYRFRNKFQDDRANYKKSARLCYTAVGTRAAAKAVEVDKMDYSIIPVPFWSR